MIPPPHLPPQGGEGEGEGNVNLFNAFVLVAKTVFNPIEFTDGKQGIQRCQQF